MKPARYVGRYLVEDRPFDFGVVTKYRGVDPDTHERVVVCEPHVPYYDDDADELFRTALGIYGALDPVAPRLLHVLGRDRQPRAAILEDIEGVRLDRMMAELRRRGELLPIPVAYAIVHHLVALYRSPVRLQLGSDDVIITPEGAVRAQPELVALQARQTVGAAVHFLDSAVAYISPESARGHQQTVASDVFTLGVLLYELIANRHPFSREGDTMFEMVSRIQRSLAPPIQAFRAVPPALATLLDCAMAPDPAARFQTWDAFLARLPLVSPDAILAAMPIPPEREPPLVLEPYDHLASDPLEELPIPPLVEPYTPIPVRAWIDNYRYGRDHRPMLHAGALLVDVAPVSRAEFQRFVLATQGPAALDPTADDSPHTFVSPRRAAEYAAWAGKRLPTNAEWTAAMVALGERARSLQIWEWTTTPAEEGFVVCGGRWRNRPALPADLANRSFETEAAEDVGFRCVQDR